MWSLQMVKLWKHCTRKSGTQKIRREKNPNLNLKEKLSIGKNGNCGTTKMLLSNCRLWELKAFVDVKCLCTTKAYWLNIWGVSGLEYFPYYAVAVNKISQSFYLLSSCILTETMILIQKNTQVRGCLAGYLKMTVSKGSSHTSSDCHTMVHWSY